MTDEYIYIGKDGRSVLARDLEDERDALREENKRLRNLISLAYGEGVLDVTSRGATLDNCMEKYNTSDAKASMDDPEFHRSEFPDDYDDAMNRANFAARSDEGKDDD